MQLSGKNFQSWAEFDLAIEGLTIVTGPSDVGKSALFRALKGIFRNELPNEWVRDDQESPMELTAEIAGHSITAKRSRKGSTTYVIDGKDFAKLAGAVPEELKAMKYTDVVIGDYDVDPIFGRQNSAQFLIDPETFKPTEVNAILGAFGGTERLERGKKEANLRKSQKDAEARTLAVQIRESEERKAALVLMQADGLLLDDTLKSLEKDIRRLEIEAHWLETAYGCGQRLEPLRQIQEALVLPDISGLEELQRLVYYAERCAESAAYCKWLWKPQLLLTTVAADWGDARFIWNQIVAIEGAIAAGKHIVSTDNLKTALSDAETSFSESVRLWKSITSLEALAALLGELKGSAERLAGVETELTAAQAELKKGLCPKCGKAMEHTCG